MKLPRQLSLTKKLALAIVVTGLVPAAVIGLLAIRTASHMASDIAGSYEVVARNVGQKIDRNLFERYGDVQAFGVNDAVNDTNSWYQAGHQNNRIAAAANDYAKLYGFYLLSYLVDLEGRVVAVNDADPSGKPIDTAWLYRKNFKDAEWFKESLAGHFLKSDLLDGTFVQDVHADEDVKKVYATDGLVVGFSAPVKNASGKTIGVWHNCANFSLVEEIIVSAYAEFKNNGLTEANLTLLDHTGRVLVDYDPAAAAGNEAVQHDANVLLKLNLAERGVEGARSLVAGHSGSRRGLDAGKSSAQVAGYSVCDGELGYPGLKWGVLVRVPEHQALAAMRSQMLVIGIVIAVSIVGLIAMGGWLGRSISQSLMRIISAIHQTGEEVASSAKELLTSSQKVAEGASEQAACLEETSASIEEMASMGRRNADSANKTKVVTNEAHAAAETGTSDMAEMDVAMNEIKASSADIAKIIKSIDEIAFQTNLLALNAAVEAARAGEAGAGFAVVADEVRSLAQRSAQSAHETSEKISTAITKSERGVQISFKVAANFERITSQTGEVNQYVAEIAAASNDQSQGVNQIGIAITQMDTVTQRNAASAEESAAAAAELTSQADLMRASVNELLRMVGGASSSASDGSATVPAPLRPSRLVAPVFRKAIRSVSQRQPEEHKAAAANHSDIPMPSPGQSAPQSKAQFKDF